MTRIGTSRLFGGYYSRFLAYSPDGKSFASGCWGNFVRFWDAETGKEIRQIPTQGNDDIFALSPDGKTLVTAHRHDSEFQLWDIVTCKKLRTMRGGKDGIRFIAFSEDGKTVAMASDTALRLWDVATWQEKQSLDAKGVFSFAFLPDSNTLVSGAQDGIRWWNLNSGREIRHLEKQFDYQYDLAFSLDGKRLAAVTRDSDVFPANRMGKLHLWNGVTGAEISVIQLDNGESWSLAFSPDSQTLLCSGPKYREPGGTQQFRTQFFAADTGQELRRWGNERPGGNMVFSPDGKSLAHMESGVIQRLDAFTGKPVINADTLPDYVMSVAFSQTGESLMASNLGWPNCNLGSTYRETVHSLAGTPQGIRRPRSHAAWDRLDSRWQESGPCGCQGSAARMGAVERQTSVPY